MESVDHLAETTTTGLDRYVRGAAAVFSLSAAAIHFAFAPHHLSEDWAHGWFFVLTAWMQAAFALVVIVRPRRWVWAAGLVLNLGIIATWAVSRTVGLPFGPEALRHEAMGVPDLVCSLLEGGIVVLAGVALLLPRWLARPIVERTFARAVAGATAIVAIVACSISLTPAYAAEHADGTAAHDHGATGTLTGTTPCELSGPPATGGQVPTDAEGHSHRGPTAQQALSEQERVQLEAQQAEARSVIARYPTVAEAEAAGYRMSVAYVPCIGAHYTNSRYALSFDPANPSELLYDGTAPDAKLVGLSYLVRSGDQPPDGFAGPNDGWHQHNGNGGLCFSKGKGVIGGESMSDADCAAAGGVKGAMQGVWMLHDWVVPGWECSWGVFAGECPELGGRTGGSAWDAPDPSADLQQAAGN